MLVLTRKIQEQIQIGENITITVLRVKGRSVRIGIEAPGEVKVLRAELPKSTEKREAAAETSVPARPRTAAMVRRQETPARETFVPAGAEQPLAAALMRRRNPDVSSTVPAVRYPDRLTPTSLRSLVAK